MRTTFWNLLNDYKVIIPMIQRDYAQGREGKEYVRYRFLNELRLALGIRNSGEMDGKDVNQERKKSTAEMDYVYGTTKCGIFYPLDGQQRLTTLWLLHWYVASKAGLIGNKPDVTRRLEKFTYETRASSREFCKALSVFDISKLENGELIKAVRNQTWYYTSWDQDPTIQSMLRMLGGTTAVDKKGVDIVDGIEEVFKEAKYEDFMDYWQIMTQGEPFAFSLMNKMDVVSDDLYIKMNARGKPLTDFENFKAEWIGFVRGEDGANDQKAVSFASLLDNDWTNVFWDNRKEDCDRIDESFFAFLNRYFFNVALVEKIIAPKNNAPDPNQLAWKLYGEESDDTKVTFISFDCYKEILQKEFKSKTGDQENVTVMKRLENLWKNVGTISGSKRTLNNLIKDALPCWFFNQKKNNEGFEFIPLCKKEDNKQGRDVYTVSTLGQKERVVFYAVCRYFENGSFEESSFKDWMRVVCNLVENPSLDNLDAMVGRLGLIDELSSYSHSILVFLINDASEISSKAAAEQLKEEIEKAKQIQQPMEGSVLPTEAASWKEAIRNAESYSFIKGAARFLFHDEKGKVNWSENGFAKKFGNFKIFFSESWTETKSNAERLRIFVSKCKTWDELKEIIYDENASTWKKNLLNAKLKSAVHGFLAMELENLDTCLSEQSFENFKSDIDDGDERHNLAQEDIVKTCLLSNLRYNGNSVSACRLRDDKYNLIALFPSGANSEQKKYVIANVRNRILAKGMSNRGIKSAQKINDCDFFWGWDIYFEYQGQQYQWSWDNKIFRVDAREKKTEIPTNASLHTDTFFDGLSNALASNQWIEDLPR